MAHIPYRTGTMGSHERRPEKVGMTVLRGFQNNFSCREKKSQPSKQLHVFCDKVMTRLMLNLRR